MKQSVQLTLTGIIAMLIISCAPRAYVEKDPSVDLSKYRTYAWVETKSSRDQNGTNPTAFAELTIRNAVDRQLQREGWTKVERTQQSRRIKGNMRSSYAGNLYPL